MITVIAFIAIICLLVVAHEYGHFLLARIFDVRVHEFSVGFGPRLFTYLRKNGTDFNVRCIPLGGFVRMSGEDPEEMDVEGGFQSKPAAVRAAVIFAGPLFSFLFAVLIFMLLGYVWGLPDGSDNSVQMVYPRTPASKMGLRAGDKVLSVNGRELREPGELVEQIRLSEGDVTLTVDRKGEILTRTAAPSLNLRYYLGANWEQDGGRIRLAGIIKDTPLFDQKAEPDSVLVSMNGVKYRGTREFFEACPKEGETVTLELEKGSRVRKYTFEARAWCGAFNGREIIFPGAVFLSARPAEGKWYDSGNVLVSINKQLVKSADDAVRALEGPAPYEISYEDEKTMVRNVRLDSLKFDKKMGIATPVLGFVPGYNLKKTGLWESMKTGLLSVWNMLTETLRMLFSSAVKENLGGPIAIVSMTNSAVNTGSFSLIILLGGLSLSLAIFNLLPIPPLDGGHLFVILMEALRRRRFTREQLIKIQVAGVAVMILIFVVVFGLDITRLVEGTLPK
ncbi:MAG: site-2 protease family protein [Abditibacteriota bacterium]|nr:site-2 protease family protein [Abditibacteriota bacterium]